MASKSELVSLLDAFQEALEYWIKISSSEITRQSTSLEDPLAELEKCSKLVRAHTTKVGIIFNPENLFKDASGLTAAVGVVQKLSATFVSLFTIFVQLDPSQLSNLFYDEVVVTVRQLLESQRVFVKDLKVIVEEEKTSDDRLISVGKIWSSCDELTTLIQGGKSGLLTEKIGESVSMIDDGFEEFVEWAEDPSSFEMGFDFGEDSEEENSETESISDSNADVKPTEDSKTKDELIAFSKLWIKKIELVKLLVASFKKSLPTTTLAKNIDLIYSLQHSLVVLIDKFISDLMLDQVVDDEIKEYTKTIASSSGKLCKLAQDIHQDNDKKKKWYGTWTEKFEGVVVK